MLYSNNTIINYIPVNERNVRGNNAIINGEEGIIFKNTFNQINVFFRTKTNEVMWNEKHFLENVLVEPINSLKETIDYNYNKKLEVSSMNSRFD